jgi:hypothetical protein
LAYGELKITINQALHGYQNGHQLLAASINLSLTAKRTLLFQSDLTGSIEPGFESYITGYPIKGSNHYVFARTWYAPEMERPGCVWTHSLLLDLADIGKLPDLSILNTLFKRPKANNFTSYESVLIFDALNIAFASKKNKSEINDYMGAIMEALYQSPNKTCLIPQNSSQNLENEILNIWSEQWPRLRRNFTFCTGSLNLKVLESEEYDLQVIPEKLITNINRQSKNGNIINFEKPHFDEWLNIFKKYDQKDIHKFLWTFGADVEGKRSNYIPLLKLFQSLHSPEFNLSEINNYISKYFPESDNGKFLKKNFYGANSILPVSEMVLIDFLLSNGNNSTINYNDLQISDRIINLINSGEITNDEIIRLFRKIDYSKIDTTFWDKNILSLELALRLIKEDPNLISVLVSHLPKIAEDIKVWQLNYSIQREILHSLNDSKTNWENVLTAVVNSGSKIIFDCRKVLGETVTNYSLQLINNGKGSSLNKDWIEYFVQNDEAFYTWILENKNALEKPVFNLMFAYLSQKQLENLGLDSKILVSYYEMVKFSAKRDIINIASCKLLSIGYDDVLKSSFLLIERTFPTVYNEVCSNRIGNNIWNYFSREYPIHDHDYFYSPFSMFSYFKKSKNKRFEVEYWDIGRQLIVKTVNHFIQNSWPLQSFVATFSGRKDFKDALQYCFTFEKGSKLIQKFICEIQQDRIKLNNEQKQIIKRMLS